jgi:segregation and condensation protein B
LEKELIVISGRNELLPGKPLVYSTSKNFMDYFGINSTDDLPKIKEVLAEQIVEATVIKPEDFTDHSVLDEVANATDKGEEEEEDANASDKGEDLPGNDLSEEQDA